MNTPEDTLDLMRDEFQRIIANPDSTPEIKGICVRAISEILVRVPIIEMRDRLERELEVARAKLSEVTATTTAEGAIKAMRTWMDLDSLAAKEAKLSERKTVHEWLNQIGAADKEENGNPMCLLRRLAVQLGIQPYSVK